MEKIVDSIRGYIGKINLVWTKDSLKELLDGGVTTPQRDIDEGSISFYDLVVGFNNMYNSFIKEYQEITRDAGVFGEKVEIDGFFHHEDTLNTKIRGVSLKITNPNFKCTNGKKDGTLRILEYNGKSYRAEYTPNVWSRGDDICGSQYGTEELMIDPNLKKKYITLFAKYEDLISIYKKLMNLCNTKSSAKMVIQIFGDEATLTGGLQGITIRSNIESDKKVAISISVSLGDEIGFDSTKSSLVIDGEKNTTLKEKDCEDILRMLRIDGSHLLSVDADSKKEKMMIKSLLDSANSKN